jgi:hypothetical protein
MRLSTLHARLHQPRASEKPGMGDGVEAAAGYNLDAPICSAWVCGALNSPIDSMGRKRAGEKPISGLKQLLKISNFLIAFLVKY